MAIPDRWAMVHIKSFVRWVKSFLEKSRISSAETLLNDLLQKEKIILNRSDKSRSTFDETLQIIRSLFSSPDGDIKFLYYCSIYVSWWHSDMKYDTKYHIEYDIEHNTKYNTKYNINNYLSNDLT